MNLFRSTKIIEKPRMWCLGLWNQDVINELDLMNVTFRSQVVQLDKYETAPNLFQLSQKFRIIIKWLYATFPKMDRVL